MNGTTPALFVTGLSHFLVSFLLRRQQNIIMPRAMTSIPTTMAPMTTNTTIGLPCEGGFRGLLKLSLEEPRVFVETEVLEVVTVDLEVPGCPVATVATRARATNGRTTDVVPNVSE